MLHRRLPVGGRVASVTTRATFAAGIDALRPRPGLSASPSKPDASKRTHHSDTRLGVVLSCNGLDPNAVEPAQDYLGALAIAHPDGGRARPPPKLRDDLGIRIQLLDRPWHLSNPPRDETTRSMLVGICGSGH